MRILIVKPSSLGDIIQALRVAQSIRDQLPEAVISWVVRDRFAEVIRRCPAVNGDLIEFNRTNWLRGAPGLFREIRSREFDVVFDFQGLLRSGLMTLAARSPLKLGHHLCREGSQLSYSRLVPLPPDGRDSHHIDLMLHFLPEIGLRAELTSPIRLQCEPPYHVDSRLHEIRPVVLLPNSREPSREWPYFADLAERILQSDSHAAVAWDTNLPFTPPASLVNERFINLSQKTGLMDLVGLLSIARLVIANDSGGTHIAAALGVPVLSLHGPTSACKSGPFPQGNGTNHVLEAANGDLSQLKTDMVLEKVLGLIASSRQRNFAA